MGANGAGWNTGFAQFDPDGAKALAHAEEDGAAKAANRVAREKRMADAEATRYLAEMDCPEDVIEFGKRHGIPVFAEATWMAGFMQGWRLAVARARSLDQQ